ncbi:hypothetical protein [Lentzea sp. E54]
MAHATGDRRFDRFRGRADLVLVGAGSFHYRFEQSAAVERLG